MRSKKSTMDHSPLRRHILQTVASAPLWMLPGAARAAGDQETLAAKAKTVLVKLEKESGCRLGVYAWDTGSDARLDYRADERFPMCSTFKAMAAAAILRHAESELETVVRFQKEDFVEYSPVTEKHLATGMTYTELCTAAIQYSDNTAANLLLKRLGGPEALTKFARAIGDTDFRLDRWETDLNTAIPDDPRDTTTPGAMARSLHRLVLGDALTSTQRGTFTGWLRGNTTGATRIKAGIPVSWVIGDKTGTGTYGTANDVAAVWPPQRKPVVITVYTTHLQKDAKPQNEVIAAVARAVVDWLA